MERENFFILLELLFDPPVTDPAQIKAAIHRGRQSWTRLQDVPGKRGQALGYLELVPEMQKVMLDPLLREKEAAAACLLRDEMMRKFEAELRVLEGKGYILPREATNIAVKYKAYGINKEMVESRAKAPITDTPPVPVKSSDEGGVIDRFTARGIQRSLSILGLTDLYAFLGEAPYSSLKKLSDAAEAKRRAAAQSTVKNAQSTSAQELAGICLSMFESFDSKQKYDRYLKISGYPALSDLIDEEYNRSKFISPEVLIRLVNFGVEAYGGKVLDFEEYIRRYCAAYSIPIDTFGGQLACPACNNKTDKDSAVCTACGAPMQGECPGCGADFDGGIAVCGQCGFLIAEMVKALEYINQAENALIESNWSSAQRGLAYAKKYWPGHEKIELLGRRAMRLEERYASYVENISDCIEHNQYYAALELIQEALNRRMRLPATMVSHVEKVVEDLEKQIAFLQDNPKNASFEAVYALVTNVSDSIELGRMLSQYPPEPPGRLIANISGRQVRLSWEKSPSAGMVHYVLVRKQASIPLTCFDGDVLYEGAGNSFVDKTAKPLVSYYYSVYVKRGSSYSDLGAVSSAPILIIPEIENLRALPVDSGVQFTWDFSPDIREIQIWRKLGGDAPVKPEDGIRLECSRLDGFSDIKIKNDVEYWYFIVAVYIVDGQRITSRGICESVVPHKLVAPIDQISIMKTDSDEDEYVINWENSQHSDIMLLASPQRHNYKSGDMVTVQDLLASFRKIDLDAKGQNSARFHFSFNGGMYFFIAVVTGKFGAVGSPRYLTHVRDVQNLTYDVIGSDLFLNLKWPVGLFSEVAVAWRFDTYPQSVDEIGTTVFTCTRQQYDYDAAVLIKDVEQSLYYFNVFAVFTAPDGTKVYSSGQKLMIDNTAQKEIFYNIKYSKPLFSSTYTMALTIRSNEECVLPKAAVVGKIGRLPLKKSDGMPLFEIDKETRLNGVITYEYKTSLLPQNLFIRLFLRDDEGYDKIRLIPMMNMKIT